MFMRIVRLVFMVAIGGAGLTGNPTFAAIAIIPGIIILVMEGKEGLIGWGALPFALLLGVALISAIFSS